MVISKAILSEQIKSQLIEEIMSDRIESGDRLIESSLAKRFGVSQSPVREALKGLAEMGLVVQEPYKGTTVRAISDEDIYEAFTVRAALESLAAEQAARVCTPEDIDRLENIIIEMEEAASKGDDNWRFKANNAFHDEIIRISGHRLVARLSKQLVFIDWSRLKALRYEEQSLYFARRHRIILDALRAGNSDLARKSMREHIEENIPLTRTHKEAGRTSTDDSRDGG
jgi:DNA-binding GntR family transcriptional regulator